MSAPCYCHIGLHAECVAPVQEDDLISCCCWVADTIEIRAELDDPVEVKEERTRALKESENVRDPLSTGRKRAAELYPITEGMTCEWAELLYAGGGIEPIVGCNGNTLSTTKNGAAIHHGPDKDTLNNAQGNTHRICTRCHNRWHTLNDQYYGKRPAGGTPFIPLGGVFKEHDPETKAAPEQIANSEVYWATPIKKRKSLR